MPTKAGLSAIQAARSSVVARARRYGAPARRDGGDGGGSEARGATAGRPSVRTARTTGVVVRRFAPGSVLKVSVLFYLSMGLILLVAGVLLWAGAHSIGLIDNFESFMSDIGFTDFRIEGRQVMRGWLVVGGVLVVGGSFANLLMAVLYNLLADVIGGIRLVLEEDDPSSPRG